MCKSGSYTARAPITTLGMEIGTPGRALVHLNLQQLGDIVASTHLINNRSKGLEKHHCEA